MDINERIDNIKSKEELIDFLNYLSKDRYKNKDEWENNTIEENL